MAPKMVPKLMIGTIIDQFLSGTIIAQPKPKIIFGLKWVAVRVGDLWPSQFDTEARDLSI